MIRILSPILFLLLFCGIPTAGADDDEITPQARILSASASREHGRILLDARVSHVLNKAARRALRRGLPLHLTAHITIYRERQIWWDDPVLSLTRRFRLEYHELSQQYVIEDLNAGTQRLVPDRRTALIELGSLRNIALFDENYLAPDGQYYGEIFLPPCKPMHFFPTTD